MPTIVITDRKSKIIPKCDQHPHAEIRCNWFEDFCEESVYDPGKKQYRCCDCLMFVTVKTVPTLFKTWLRFE